MKKSYKIYTLILDGVEVYVGQTSKKYVSDRVATHRFHNKTGNRPFKEFDSYRIICETDTKSDADRLESYYIKLYDTFHNGANSTCDGLGCRGNETATKAATKASIIVTSKKIRVYNDTFDEIFESCSEAARVLNLQSSNLSKVALGKRNHHKGFKSEYIN